MTPFLFGEGAQALFGAFHDARWASPGAPAVLLCAPFGEEGVRIHRTFRIIAERLADQGAPVLRFDYHGAGDSGGDSDDVSLSSMAADIAAAHGELGGFVGERRVVWIGLRLGAAAALRAALETRPRGLVGLLLWEPVADGADYLSALSAAHIRQLGDVFDQPTETIARRGAADGPEGPREALGFPISDVMRGELRDFDIKRLTGRAARRIMVIADEETPNRDAVCAALSETARHVDWISVDEPAPWNSDDAMNAFVTPAATVARICELIGGWR